MEKTMGNDTSSLMLILTNQCNLRCVYCYENSDCQVMSFETARDILDRQLRRRAPGERARIEFFGGEVLTQFPLLKRICEYALQTYEHLDLHFAITTNGTLMHGEIQSWFAEHGDCFDCTLSLDGTPAMHDRNRRTRGGGGSYSLIDTAFFLKNWPRCTAKMTISDRTLPEMAEGIMAIEAMGFACKATFASGIAWDVPAIRDTLTAELEKLVAYYSENDRPLCHLFDLDLRAIFSKPDAPFRYCDAGVGRVCYDVRGRQYPCQGLASVSLGEEKARLFENERFADFSLQDGNPCKTCRWLRVCRTCFAANYLETGCIENVDRNTCYLNRMSILASSAIQYRRIIKCPEKTLAQKQTVMAVAEIQKNILSEYGLKSI